MECRRCNILQSTIYPDIAMVVGFLLAQTRWVHAKGLADHTKVCSLDILANSIIVGSIPSTSDGIIPPKFATIRGKAQTRCGIKKIFSFRCGPIVFTADGNVAFNDVAFVYRGAFDPTLG